MGNERISRRNALKIGAAAGLGLGLGELGVDVKALIQAKEIHYPIYSVSMRGLQESLWVVQATDLHFGINGWDFVDEEVCRDVTNNVAETLRVIGARAERTILAFTGDGVTGGGKDRTPIDLFRACMGTICEGVPAGFCFAVPGNHEVFYDMYEGMGTKSIRREYEKFGCETLGWKVSGRNIVQPASLPVQIIGTPDYTTDPEWYKSFREDLFLTDSKKPNLWLIHNASPFDFEGWGGMVNENGIDTLVTAGHSHGGQIRGHSLLQAIGEWYALRSIGYESDLITGMYEMGEHVKTGVCNGIGSSAARVRTTDRQFTIYELRPAA